MNDPMLTQMILSLKAQVDAIALYLANSQEPEAPACKHTQREDLSTMGEEPWSSWRCKTCGYSEGVGVNDEVQ